MKSAQDFLLAAKHCEIDALEQLRTTCELVTGLSELIHSLQRERGASNVYLGSSGIRFSQVLQHQVHESSRAEKKLRNQFSRLDQHLGSVRLFSRIAFVLHGFETLARLRERIRAVQLSSREATTAFSRLIAGLLAIVFEAADTAADPEVTRLLVAMFNFMQGKELSGQERAAGAMGFTAGFFTAEEQQRMVYLLDAQERCFDIFYQFGPAKVLDAWRELAESRLCAELKALRQIARKASEAQPVPSELGELWFELATQRIDKMKLIENQLADALVQLSAYKIVEARADLHSHKDVLATFNEAATPPLVPMAVLLDSSMMGLGAVLQSQKLSVEDMSPHLSHSLFDLVQAQAQRLQSVSDELSAAKRALHERKQIERAKGVLMAHRGLTEEQAYKMLRQSAMDQSRRMVDVAEAILNVADLLQEKRQVNIPVI